VIASLGNLLDAFTVTSAWDMWLLLVASRRVAVAVVQKSVGAWLCWEWVYRRRIPPRVQVNHINSL